MTRALAAALLVALVVAGVQAEQCSLYDSNQPITQSVLVDGVYVNGVRGIKKTNETVETNLGTITYGDIIDIRIDFTSSNFEAIEFDEIPIEFVSFTNFDSGVSGSVIQEVSYSSDSIALAESFPSVVTPDDPNRLTSVTAKIMLVPQWDLDQLDNVLNIKLRFSCVDSSSESVEIATGTLKIVYSTAIFPPPPAVCLTTNGDTSCNSSTSLYQGISPTFTVPGSTASFCGEMTMRIALDTSLITPLYESGDPVEQLLVRDVYQVLSEDYPDKVRLSPPEGDDAVSGTWMVQNTSLIAPLQRTGYFKIAFEDVYAGVSSPVELAAMVCFNLNTRSSNVDIIFYEPYCFTFAANLLPPTAVLTLATGETEGFTFATQTIQDSVFDYTLPPTPFLVNSPLWKIGIRVRGIGSALNFLPLWVWDVELEDKSRVATVRSRFEAETGLCESDRNGRRAGYRPETDFTFRVRGRTVTDVGNYNLSLSFQTPYGPQLINLVAPIVPCPENMVVDPETWQCVCPRGSVPEADTCKCVDSLWVPPRGSADGYCRCLGDLRFQEEDSQFCTCPASFEKVGTDENPGLAIYCQCPAGFAEDDNECVPSIPDGGRCTPLTADLCEDVCVDGVCCATTCPGVCRACKVEGSEGECLEWSRGDDPDEECPGLGCNGRGECLLLCSSDEDCDFTYVCNENRQCRSTLKQYSKDLFMDVSYNTSLGDSDEMLQDFRAAFVGFINDNVRDIVNRVSPAEILIHKVEKSDDVQVEGFGFAKLHWALENARVTDLDVVLAFLYRVNLPEMSDSTYSSTFSSTTTTDGVVYNLTLSSDFIIHGPIYYEPEPMESSVDEIVPPDLKKILGDGVTSVPAFLGGFTVIVACVPCFWILSSRISARAEKARAEAEAELGLMAKESKDNSEE